MRAYRALLSVIATRPAPLIVAAVMAALLVAVTLAPISTPGRVWSRSNFEMVYDQCKGQAESLAAAGAPQMFVDQARAAEELLGRALAQSDEASFYRALGDYELNRLEVYQSGTVSGFDVETDIANQVYLIALSEMEEPVNYERAHELPGAFAALWALGDLAPYFLPFVAVLLVAWDVSSLFRRGSLLGAAPIGRWRSLLMAWSGSWLCSLGLLTLAVLPCTLVAAARNGWGDLSYPSVYVQSGELVTSTLGASLGTYAALLALASAFLCAAVCCVSWVCGSPMAGAAVAAALCLLPEFPFWEADGPSVFSLLPSTYLDLPRIAPPLTAGTAGEVSAVFGAVPGRGFAVLGSWCAALLAASCVALALAAVRREPSCVDASEGILAVKGLTLSFGGRTVVEDASFELRRGALYGLVAPNGSGKTTLLRALAAEASCSVRGAVYADGVSLAPSAAYRAKVHYAPGGSPRRFVPHLSVRRHLRLVKVLWASQRNMDNAVSLFGLEPFLGKAPGRLSQGMAQLAALGVAYMTAAPYLLLDEPMNALDPTNVKRVSAALREMAREGASIVMSSHILSNVDELCDAVFYLSGKKPVLYEGGGAAEVYERMFGV